jgi:nucleotide-binding universal stress UspA family protein
MMSNTYLLPVEQTNPAARAGLLSMPPPDVGQAAETPRASPRLRRILVATDGAAASEGALTVAGLLARRDGAVIDVVSVLPRWGPPPAVHEFLDMTGELLNSRLARVFPQGERALGDSGTRWTVNVIDGGSVVESIVEAAEVQGHDLIVTGRGRGWVDRWLRRPTALAVAQHSAIPVLVVPPSVTALPTRAVVSVDGTDADSSIATAAVGVLAESAALHLVHGGPGAADAERSVGWARRLASLERALNRLGPAAVERVVVRAGEPAAGLLAYAETIGADLIAVGARQPATTLRDRVIGGISRQVLRAADSCVLLCGAASPDGAA